MSAVIYIVDDDDAVRESLGLLLESAGYQPKAFSSGLDLLRLESLHQPCCVVLDVRMPDIDGLELQDRLLTRHPHLPIIVMTGHGDVPIAVRAMKQGAFDFLEKPFHADGLLESIEQALALAESKAKAIEEDPPPTSQDNEVKTRLAGLTPRELEVLQGLVAGHSNKMIAHLLGISPRTVEIHRARVKDKMRARSVSHLVRMALVAGVVVPES